MTEIKEQRKQRNVLKMHHYIPTSRIHYSIYWFNIIGDLKIKSALGIPP